ncbi:phage tail protein [Clostridioides difficile]|uniref:phage tail protein n=1 Tax=Clostridioides difficile TaxID=1496 RepID=UPI00038CACF6|nr:phage tail protein [Clostridioides difficile]EGT4638669.1 phage tail protein [Clostridioides difficile]EQJ86266.1 phage tail-collar fiber family protein [Clostridioides difficile P48]MBH8106223.1 phage tail protein [Clostridioides difficile]MBJ9796945.1 phage tail protein [Clostridioides difficile]MBY1604053.1 phage tail protein [Clostridioides difficile]
MAEQKYYTLLTTIGKASIANATALGNKVDLVKLQLGDGAGTEYNPTEEQTSLKNVVWEGSVNNVKIDEENPNWIVIETVIPGSVGGFMIREVGIFDSKEQLIAVSKYPETYKPTADSGSVKDLVIKIILVVSNTSSVNLKVDPTVILATLKDIQELDTKIDTTKTGLTSNIETAKTELSAKIDTENEKQNIKIDQLIAGGSNVASTQTITIDDWVEDAENGFKATVTHSLLTQRIVVNIIDATTKENIVPNFKIVDDNSIEIRSEVKVELNVYVINGNAETHFINATVDDNRVSEMTTYSSKKIEDKFLDLEEKVNGGLSSIATSVNELITYC